MRRPTPALVVACLALLVSLGGTSYATVLNVPRNSVGTPHLKRNAVRPAKLAPNAVRTAHVLNGSLLAADFKAGQLPAGAKGDKGDKGDKGEPGPVGISGYERIELISAQNSDGLKFLSVPCPAGKRVLGGGAHTDGGPGTTTPLVVALTASNPAPGNNTTWHAAGREVVATGSSWRLRAHVICATIP